MNKRDVKEGAVVLVPRITVQKATVIRQLNPYRTLVRLEDGNEGIVSTRNMSPA